MKYVQNSLSPRRDSKDGLEVSPAYYERSGSPIVTQDLHKANNKCVETFDFPNQASINFDELSPKTTSPALSVNNQVVWKIIERSKSRWIDDPVISQWRNLEHKIYGVLSKVDDLYNNWVSFKPAPFALSPDPLWLDVGHALASVGLPWHNNQVNLPDEIDTSWPFHFKAFEARVIQTKGARVGDPNPSGYISNYDEANLYCIRALQQEFRERLPTQRPILAYDHFDNELILSARKLFGLEVRHVSLCSLMEDLKQQLRDATSNGTRPIIFAATLCNFSAEYDDLSAVSLLSHDFPLLLHVDAFRSFDYVTVSPNHDDRSGEKLMLVARDFRQPLRGSDKSIWASTIVAGGLNLSRHDPAIALKPSSLGEKSTRVAYIRALDSTLSGSRDAIAPLWLALYEERLGNRGLQELFQYLLSLRSFVLRSLENLNISATTSPYSTDIMVQSYTKCQKQWLVALGGAITAEETIILSINPHSSAIQLRSLLNTKLPLSCSNRENQAIPRYKDFVALYPISQEILRELQTTIQSWQITSRSMAGYPLHMGSYSALGPVIGLFLDVNIPKDWTERKSQEILSSHMETFGLISVESRKDFKGAFTTGSTMGNRCGIMNALEQFPDAFVYFSAETHYSVIKTLRDCDTLTNRWAGGEPRYSQIRCASNGCILVEALAQQVVADKNRCAARGVKYHMILLVNIGTTFVGARDDIFGIYRDLGRLGITISYIHVDGALDFGFDTCGVKLGPPGAVDNDGMPLVQGITMSHHKALGHMVSGEVLCFNPKNTPLIPCSSVDSRAVFEHWFYNRVYSPSDLALMLSYCHENASRLQTGLNRIGVATKRNEYSIITVLGRPPSWIIEEFSLRPEGDWVHFITMPHVSKEIVDRFLDELAYIDKQFSAAFSCVMPLLNDNLGRKVELKRVRCCSALAERVSKLTQWLIRPNDTRYQDKSLARNINSKLRGALSAVVVDEQDEIQVVLVAGSGRDQSIRVGPLLIRNQFSHCKATLADISKLLVGLLARYLKARINEDNLSYQIYTF
ncbi:PLP-dependent transferase [Ustulina deusta]|nr:PLP-dependent transferase [Ustulina deusta]